ncbi:ABC transporter permease [Lactococcus kimchii]|uniref:ABC transporter permease n=1 Tax=Lactococcus sp. S-13 TaxID=2507158 RepID=UPI0010236A9B|nr:ABC transporter permease [Lactococcus sp. S-13]RZI48370.1 ABC transporter permease [Lactococcus sp. S-13]
MNQPLSKTGTMLKVLLKRDWLKLIFWLLGLLAFAASGVGKMEVAASPATASTMYTMFVKNPAMIGLFGTTPIKSPAAYSLGPIFGQTMTLITAITFAIISIIYVINRTRKEEDDGIAELFRSYSIGKLANTTAVVLELMALHLIIAFALALSIQAQNVTGLNDWHSNLLFACSTSAQGLLWGMFTLFFAQVFPDATGAKGATFGLLGLFYILRMGTDVSAVHAGWFNPLAWSYLGFPYAKSFENWLGVVLALLLAGVLLLLAYLLEMKRDIGAGYLPEGRGRAQAKKSLLSLPGLVLSLQKKMIFAWLVAFFVLGLVYGSMFGQMDEFINSNPTVKQIFVGDATAHKAIVGNFMVTLFSILSILVAAFAVILLSRMTTEERKNRQEQLYALPVSRAKVYWTYVILALVASLFAQFLTAVGIYIEQKSMENPLTFAEIIQPALVWVVGIVFVLALLSLLIAFLPRAVGLIWGYVGFLLFMTYLGRLLDLPQWLEKLNIYDYLPKMPVEQMAWTPVLTILLLSAGLMTVAYMGYRKRDLIGG